MLQKWLFVLKINCIREELRERILKITVKGNPSEMEIDLVSNGN